MAITITGYEDLIFGEDGNSAEAITKCIRQAYDHVKEDKSRIRVEIRCKHKGSPSSRQEAQFNVDPTSVSTDDLKRILVDKLEQSPGPEFSGQIRINFTPVGSSGTNIGSFAREVIYTSASSLSRVREDDDEADEEDNSPARMFQRPMGVGLPEDPSGAILMNPQQLQQWLEVTMGFAFRAMAQNMTMFDRTTRMLENYALRFGMPERSHPGVVEVRDEPKTAQAPAGGGILPMLLQAVAGLANSQSTQATASAPTPTPTRGAMNRVAAVQHAGEAIARVRPRRPMDGFDPAPPLPREEPTRSHHEDEEVDYPIARRESGAMRRYHQEDEGAAEPPNDDSGGDPMGAIKDASADDMMDLIKAWVEARPENKAAIMDNLPKLTQLIM